MCGLKDGSGQRAKTLWLRCLPVNATELSMLATLRVIAPGQFDFLTVCRQSLDSFAVINFTNAESAVAFQEFIEALNKYETVPVVMNTSRKQGVKASLAYFLARFGWNITAWPCMPLLFNGVTQLSREQTLKVFAELPPHLLYEAQAAVDDETACCTWQPTKPGNAHVNAAE
mmetsp:Transcript_24081/g.45460  ORF Transcript_24081/g.45460 Transcript_24081/m.45460 type:complete len:172 (+) Transcript_24081:73-588(+)